MRAIDLLSIFLFVILHVLNLNAQENTEVCNTICLTEAGMDGHKVSGIYPVVSPIGKQSVPMITQAPRLHTLEGKTIAVVGGSFMASTTHPEIKRLILKNYPTAKVILLNEIGSAGVYPAPGVTRRSKDEFQQRLKEMKVDAVISGNGGCGLCTPKETGSSIAAEYIGIPAVTIAAPGFAGQVLKTSLNNGVPAPRVAIYPGAFAAHTHDELIRNTREVVFPQIIEALTRPFTAEETGNLRKNAKYEPKEIAYAGDLTDINNYFSEMRWSDGLPIVPPTIEKVEEFLKYTDYAWDESLGNFPVAHREVLVWHVAVNGVMAGCPPEYMPLLIAYAKAMKDPHYRRTLSSTHAWTPYCWLNGPLARQLGIDSGQGEISEPQNAKIGRFINLAMLNLCGYYIKQDRMGTFGYLMPWCMVEDDAACRKIGWQPFHVEKGYKINQNTMTACSALMWGNNLAPSTADAEQIMTDMSWDITEKSQFGLGSGKQYVYRTILVTEFVAHDLSIKYHSKSALEDALIKTARRPAYQRAYANYYANPGSAFESVRYPFDQHLSRIVQREQGELTEIPAWFPASEKQSQMYTVPVMKSGMSPILITGDANRNKVQCMPGGDYVTIEIELPGNWDQLMEELGYKPLEEFYIE